MAQSVVPNLCLRLFCTSLYIERPISFPSLPNFSPVLFKLHDGSMMNACGLGKLCSDNTRVCIRDVLAWVSTREKKASTFICCEGKKQLSWRSVGLKGQKLQVPFPSTTFTPVVYGYSLFLSHAQVKHTLAHLSTFSTWGK